VPVRSASGSLKNHHTPAISLDIARRGSDTRSDSDDTAVSLAPYRAGACSISGMRRPEEENGKEKGPPAESGGP